MLDPVYGYRDDLAEHFKPVSGIANVLHVHNYSAGSNPPRGVIPCANST